MTEQQLFVNVAEIRALRLQCRKCRASVSVEPSTWTGSVHRCPSCQQEWPFARMEKDPVKALIGAVLLLQQDKTDWMPSMLIEVDPPKSSAS